MAGKRGRREVGTPAGGRLTATAAAAAEAAAGSGAIEKTGVPSGTAMRDCALQFLQSLFGALI